MTSTPPPRHPVRVGTTPPTPSPPPAGFDPTLLTALRLRAAGLTVAAIAQRTGYSERTVKGHLTRARHHYGATNIVHTVAIATAAGHITADDLNP